MPSTFLFAGGGSGGHISPGLAVAERILERAADAQCRFICSERAVDRVMLQEAGMAFHAMPACGLRRSPRGMLAFWRGYRGTTRAMRRMLQDGPCDMILTLGGYVAAPVAAAATLESVPVTLLNLDRKPGKANRRIAAWTRNRLTAVPLLHPRPDWNIVGMPVRRSALAVGSAAQCREALELLPDRKVLLVTGASQGARILNTVLPRIAAERPGMLDGWQVLHLCGDESLVEPLSAEWKTNGINARVLGFLHGMGLAWGAADACVSRAGASSVAESHANSVPTIFLPYPYGDNHQQFNAQPLVDLGGAGLVTDTMNDQKTATALGDALGTLLQSEDLRQQMRAVLQREVWIDAADIVAGHLLDAVSENSAAKA